MMMPCSEEEYFYKLDNMVIRSTQCLRQVFKQRWKVESREEWKDDPNYIQNFLVKRCESILNKAIPFQKKILLESCSLEDWDMSLMSLVLLNFGNGKKYKFHNKAIRQLKDLRNDLAHHKTKKLTQSEYCESVKLFKESLQILGVEKSQIVKLTKKSAVGTSLEALERVKVFMKHGEQLIKMQKFENALNLYSEALTIPRLSSDNVGEIYEKRAVCYLNINEGQQVVEKYSKQAILDLEQALKINKLSWNALYVMAQCHKKKNNLPEAIRYYEMALAISPVQKQVKLELDSCRLLCEAQNCNGRLNIDHLPGSLKEHVWQLKINTGCELTVQSYIEIQSRFPSFVGDQYYHGWEVTQDYKMAVKYYTKADKQGYAEGCFKLGQCYFDGRGVEQDVGIGFELFKRCAGMNAKSQGRFQPTPLGFNKFVALAEYYIGSCYKDGLGVEKNIQQAAVWYLRAMKHGLGRAASVLGQMFCTFCISDFMHKSDKMAEMCWKQGIILNSSISAELLVDYYQAQFEPYMAWTMLRIAREMGSSRFLKMSDEEFNQNLTWVQSERCRVEDWVILCEEQQKLGFKGMTFSQRIYRTEKHFRPMDAQIRENESLGGQIQQIGENVMMAVQLKAVSGSKTAYEVIKTFENILEFNELLEVQNDSSKAYQSKAVNLFYDVMCLQHHLAVFMQNRDKFEAIVAKLFNTTCEKKGEEDMKVRLCYVATILRQSLKATDDLYAFGILQEGRRRYPDNYCYYRVETDCFKTRGFDAVHYVYKALDCVNEALDKFPDKVDLYYDKVQILRQSEKSVACEIIAALKAFLCNAPRDHRFVPEAYYVTSHVYVKEYMDHQKDSNFEYMNNKSLKLIQDSFESGKDAETDQLPCYQPYCVSKTQLIVARFLRKFDQSDKLEKILNDYRLKDSVEQMQHVFKQKEYMQSPVREGLILQHRERLRDTIELTKKGSILDDEIFSVKFQQPRAKKLCELKFITLQEMNPTIDRIYENMILDLTIIDEPNPYYAATEIVAEDENGDTTRVYIGYSKNKHNLHRFQPGCRFAVINPYMWIIATKGINGICVNEPRCIMHLEKAKNICRFCGEEDSIRKCSKCKRPYCSRECQKLDWKLFEHKIICSIIPGNNRPTSITSEKGFI